MAQALQRRIDEPVAGYIANGVDATTLLTPNDDPLEAQRVLTQHGGKEMGAKVPFPAPTLAKQRAFSEIDDDLLARLIARWHIKKGAPEFSWEFWRKWHDTNHFWSLLAARPVSSWQSRWVWKEDVLLPRVQQYRQDNTDGALVTDPIVSAQRASRRRACASDSRALTPCRRPSPVCQRRQRHRHCPHRVLRRQLRLLPTLRRPRTPTTLTRTSKGPPSSVCRPSGERWEE